MTYEDAQPAVCAADVRFREHPVDQHGTVLVGRNRLSRSGPNRLKFCRLSRSTIRPVKTSVRRYQGIADFFRISFGSTHEPI